MIAYPMCDYKKNLIRYLAPMRHAAKTHNELIFELKASVLLYKQYVKNQSLNNLTLGEINKLIDGESDTKKHLELKYWEEQCIDSLRKYLQIVDIKDENIKDEDRCLLLNLDSMMTSLACIDSENKKKLETDVVSAVKDFLRRTDNLY